MTFSTTRGSHGLEFMMGNEFKSLRRTTKTRSRPELTEYVPITSGPARELTDEDFDKIDARIDELQRYGAKVLASLRALNAKMGIG